MDEESKRSTIFEARSTIRTTIRDNVCEDDPSECDTTFKIVMIRSGDVEWEDNEIYCGWYDSKLTVEGKEKLLKASNSLKLDNYTFDLAFSSTLNRCKESLSIILNELELQDIEIIARWELNERHCGCLTALVTNDLERKIFEAFDVFDHANNRTVDIREIGTVIRALGCIPTEEELTEILEEIEDPESRGKVHLAKFISFMSRIFTEHKYMPATPDKLLEAFHALDTERIGYVTREFLTKIITEEGEPFTEDEVEEMMAVAVDPTTDTIPYEYYINQIMFEPSEEDNLYVLADKIEAERPKTKDRTMTEILRAAQELEEGEGGEGGEVGEQGEKKVF